MYNSIFKLLDIIEKLMIQLILTGYIILVIFLSLIPSAAIGGAMPSDKLAHFLAYGVMGVLASLSVKSISKKVLLFILIIGLGILLELLQFYIPGRSASLFDIIANTLGAVAGYLAVWLFISVLLNNIDIKKELPVDTKNRGLRNNLEKVP